jgi:hypothetical protein
VEHSGNTHKDKNTDNNVVRSVRISFLWLGSLLNS